MDEEGTEIGFRSVQLFKAQSLGIGSYGAVCKAMCDDLLCAAKLLHPILFDPAARAQASRGREHRLPISRFEQECRFLSSIKHPNIVQYLGTYQDPENRMPVLLMELMDESLTSFLERPQRNVPYHIQVTISHDIALALSFLHSNGIVHRDLSSNNVLMIGNSRAKVTDFGMAKLAGANPQTTRVSLTQTPGADVYMSPEATLTPPVYSAKIDSFSHGVLGVQIMTRQFPKPGNRLKTIEIDHPNYPSGRVRVAVPEIERRQEHIDLINPTHPLLAVALDCLKDEEGERPTARELCGRLAALKQAPQFSQSVRPTPQQSAPDEGAVRKLLQDNQQLQQEIGARDRSLAGNARTVASKDQIIEEGRRIVALKDQELAAKDTSLARYRNEIQQRRRDVRTLTQEKAHLLETHEANDGDLKRMRQEIEEKERKIVEFQQALLRKAGRISQLEGQLERPLEVSSGGAEGPARMELKWRGGRNALRVMLRGSNAVVQDSEVYLIPETQQVHGYNSSPAKEWFRLPDYPYEYSTLAVVDNLLTAIGGSYGSRYTDTLVSLTEKGGAKKWMEKFPSMPTKRDCTCAVSSGTALIVIGGEGETQKKLSMVEVMDISNGRWSTAANLPELLYVASATICGGCIYVLGGLDESGSPTKSVFTCSLSALLQSCQPTSLARYLQAASLTDSTSVWSKAADLPVKASTCVMFSGRLLAIGGFVSDFKHPTTAVHKYDPTTNSWSVISHMTTPRTLCFAAVLPGNKLIVIGGITDGGFKTNSMEIATLL